MTLQEQIQWEKECIERGSARYFMKQDQMREHHQADKTDVVSYLLRERLESVAAEIEKLSKIHIGKGGKNNWILRRATLDQDYMKMAYIGVKTTFEILMEKQSNTVVRICSNISSRLEADLKCKMFRALHPVYLQKVEQSFRDHNVSSYKHRHGVLMKKFAEFDYSWAEWTASRKIKLGQRILQCILKVFEDVMEIGYFHRGIKRYATVKVTDKFTEWLKSFETARGFLFPALLPLKIQPRNWSKASGGGYYTHDLVARTPFIKTRGRDHKAFTNQYDTEQHYAAVNKLQRTAWRINTRILKIQNEVYHHDLKIGMPSSTIITPNEFPAHLKNIDREDLTPDQKLEIREWKIEAKSYYQKEQRRKGKLISFMQSHKLANELATWPEFYYVYTCDFRGRIYCATTGLSPQGADSARGLIQYADGVRVGDAGLFWTAVAGANLYGVDKVSFKDRVKWVQDNRVHIEQVVSDPIRYSSFWADADKPYQFLAFCFEWYGMNYGSNPDALGYMHIGLDGSCNGLQHYSAMLRDKTGAKATNLMDSEKPEDIYNEVAKVCMLKLQALVNDLHDSEDVNDIQKVIMAKKWLHVGVSRKCAKRPVMTLPYGSTMRSAREYVMEYNVDNWHLFELEEKFQWPYACFLTPILWKAIGEVVFAARSAMTWMQKGVDTTFMSWITPVGFPVYQYYKDVPGLTISTELNGKLQISYKDVNHRAPASRRFQKSGVAPNFIHSIDSSHLVMTLNRTNFHSYTAIHDDLGTHAGNTQELYDAIRAAFLDLYTNFDPLVDWAEQIGRTDPLPEKGDYDIQDIMKATYFFS